jgi:4-amino-4-deoxy-L-arabinose transferase-like glycosyltransferase
VLLVVLAFAVRLVAALSAQDRPVTADAHIYDRHARAIAATGAYPTYREDGRQTQDVAWPPGYPFFLAGVYRLTGQSLAYDRHGSGRSRWEVVRIAQALLGTLAASLIGLIAAQLWGRRTGVIALGLATVFLPLVVLDMMLMSEALLVPLVLGAVACALRARSTRRPLPWVLATGLLTGIGTLTHENAIVLLVPFVIALWPRPVRLRGLVRGPVALVLATVLAIAPWTIRNAVHWHAFVPVTAHMGKTLAGAFNPTSRHYARRPAAWLSAWRDPGLRRLTTRYPNELARDRAEREAAVRYMRRHPGYVLEAFALHTLRMAGLVDLRPLHDLRLGLTRWTVWYFWAVALLAVAGAFTQAARASPRWLWLAPLLLWVSAAFTSEELRFRAPLDPFFVLLAAVALSRLTDRAPRVRALAAASRGLSGPT